MRAPRWWRHAEMKTPSKGLSWESGLDVNAQISETCWFKVRTFRSASWFWGPKWSQHIVAICFTRFYLIIEFVSFAFISSCVFRFQPLERGLQKPLLQCRRDDHPAIFTWKLILSTCKKEPTAETLEWKGLVVNESGKWYWGFLNVFHYLVDDNQYVRSQHVKSRPGAVSVKSMRSPDTFRRLHAQNVKAGIGLSLGRYGRGKK